MRRHVLSFAFLFVVTGAYLYGQLGEVPASLTTVSLADDLFVLSNPFVPGNTVVLVSDEGVLLIDDKFAVDFGNIVAAVSRITDRPIQYVVNTHHHADHSGSNPALQALGARVISSEAARRNNRSAALPVPGEPDVTFDDTAHIRIGGKRVDLYHFGRAHTDGDVVALLPDHGILVTGDIFTFGDDVPQLIDYTAGGSAREWPRTLGAVLQLPFDQVVPGHGPVARRTDLEAFRQVTADTAGRVREILRDGGTQGMVASMLREDFNWTELQLGFGLDGILAEMR